MIENLLELLPFIPFVVGRSAAVLPNPFGAAIAASTENLASMMLQLRSLQLREQQLTDIENDRLLSRRMQRAQILLGTAEPGAPLGEQSPLIQGAVSELLGRDVSQDPTLANVQVNPLDPDDKLTQATLEYLEELERTDPEAANLYKQELGLGRPLAEVRADESAAARRVRLHGAISGIMDRVAQGEGSPEDQRLIRNMIAEETGTEPRILAVGPEGETMVVDETIASTLVSQWWQAAREGATSNTDVLQTLGESLVTAMDNLGFQIDLGLATNIMGAIADGDIEALEAIGARGPTAQTAIEVSLQGRAGVAAYSQIWISSLPPLVRQTVQAGLGQLMAMREVGLPSDQLLEQAKNISELAKAAAEAEGLDPDSIPLITNPDALIEMGTGAVIGAGVGAAIGRVGGAALGSAGGPAGSVVGGLAGGMAGAGIGRLLGRGGAEFQPGQVPGVVPEGGGISLQDVLQRQGVGQGEETETSERDTILGQIFLDLQEGTTSLADARREFDLTPEEIRALGRMLREAR